MRSASRRAVVLYAVTVSCLLVLGDAWLAASRLVIGPDAYGGLSEARVAALNHGQSSGVAAVYLTFITAFAVPIAVAARWPLGLTAGMAGTAAAVAAITFGLQSARMGTAFAVVLAAAAVVVLVPIMRCSRAPT